MTKYVVKSNGIPISSFDTLEETNEFVERDCMMHDGIEIEEWKNGKLIETKPVNG